MSSKSTRQIFLGPVSVGGGAPVRVQSMTNTDTRDVEATVAQIGRLAKLGCEIARIAVLDAKAALAAKKIIEVSPLPIVADIHFDYALAIAAMEAGVAGVRVNPGNLGGADKLARVTDAARANGVVVRVGVNSGSLQKELLARHGAPTPEALVESALGYARAMEKRGFYDIKLSLKSSSPVNAIDAYRRAARLCDYPLHLGVTEAGGLVRGAVKSAVAFGVLLAEGVGDTIRVSLTADPEEEVRVAWEILRAAGARRRGPEIVSCPTCGRTEINLFELAAAVEKELADSDADIKVAVMGCPVNGPGEAREADIGLAGGKDKGIIFRKGKIVGSASGQAALLEAFTRELRALLAEKAGKTD